MRIAANARRTVASVAAGLVLLAGCGGAGGDGGGSEDGGKGRDHGRGDTAARPYGADAGARLTGIPDVGKAMAARIPSASRQVVAVYGDGADSPNATVVLYGKDGDGWRRQASWPAHNGRRGWTTDHHEDDLRTPVGVFTLSDAGGVLPEPAAKLPYTHSAAFTPPAYWSKITRHDFDYVIAIDYNRVKGTTPLDPTRPAGQAKGGGIWLHVDHGSGTSGCVSVSPSAMKYLLRTLDPKQHPVVVMGDKANLAG
ncbi:L,D-transpeptidase family protein [Streptomyces sp. NPDC003077]|uniref:L,D-transpeptidase family protein n=1 Tax=Streptomyces sp. NPDC003077 TaxID=3154443 RepID=UPI0033AF8F7E